jgi:hypothetical protein
MAGAPSFQVMTADHVRDLPLPMAEMGDRVVLSRHVLWALPDPVDGL